MVIPDEASCLRKLTHLPQKMEDVVENCPSVAHRPKQARCRVHVALTEHSVLWYRGVASKTGCNREGAGSISRSIGCRHSIVFFLVVRVYHGDYGACKMIGEKTISVLRSVALSGSQSGNSVTMSRVNLSRLLRMAFEHSFDEDWYLDKYPDVKEAIEMELFKSGIDHFCLSGAFEGRLPCKINLDEEAYLSIHADVAAAIAKKEVSSATEHFENSGHLEGRRFSLSV